MGGRVRVGVVEVVEVVRTASRAYSLERRKRLLFLSFRKLEA